MVILSSRTERESMGFDDSVNSGYPCFLDKLCPPSFKIPRCPDDTQTMMDEL